MTRVPEYPAGCQAVLDQEQVASIVLPAGMDAAGQLVQLLGSKFKLQLQQSGDGCFVVSTGVHVRSLFVESSLSRLLAVLATATRLDTSKDEPPIIMIYRQYNGMDQTGLN